MWSLSMFGIGVVLWVELPVQRRLCLIFVRDVGSPDIHECFRGLTGGQRTPWIWGVTKSVIRATPSTQEVYKMSPKGGTKKMKKETKKPTD